TQYKERSAPRRDHRSDRHSQSHCLLCLVGLVRLSFATRLKLFVHEQLASGTLRGQPSNGGYGRLECSIADCLARANRLAPCSVRSLEFSWLAWARAREDFFSASA